MTYTKQSDIVADEVMDHANFLWGLSVSLEQAGGENGGQFFTRHMVEVGTLLNPESQGETCLEKKKTDTQYLHTEINTNTLVVKIYHAHTLYTLP